MILIGDVVWTGGVISLDIKDNPDILECVGEIRHICDQLEDGRWLVVEVEIQLKPDGSPFLLVRDVETYDKKPDDFCWEECL